MAVDVASLVIRVSSLEAQAAARDLDRLSTASGHADRSARQMSGGFASVGSALKGMLASLAAVAGVSALAQSFMAANTAAGALRGSLATVTGSMETATKAWGALQAFAAQTPFSLEQAVQGFIKLKAMGLDPSQRALMSYGNTASAMGKSLNQMIEAVADAATGEFERLKEFGIKAKVEGDSVALTFQGITTKIGNSAQEIEDYLIKIGETTFAGAMERQAKTLGGALSNIGDSWDQLMVTLGDTGATDDIGESIAKVSSLLNDLNASLEQGMPVGELGAQLAELEAATGGWGEAILGIAPAWQEIFSLLDEIPNYVISIRDGALAIEEQGTAWDSVKELMIAFGDAMIALPDNLQKAVYIILGEIDILQIEFQAGMDSLPLYAQIAWAYIENIILTAWVNIKIAVSEAITWIAGRLASMATDMAGFFSKVPETLDIGGMAAASAAQMTGLAASLNSTGEATAKLKIEKVALGEAYAANSGKIKGEISAIQDNSKAQTEAIRDVIDAGIKDVDAKNKRRIAQVELSKEFAVAVGEEAKLQKQYELGMTADARAAKVKEELTKKVKALYEANVPGVKQHQALVAAQATLNAAEKAGIDVSKQKADILKALKSAEDSATGAKKAGAKASGDAAKAAKEYVSDLDALIKKFLPARDDAKKLAEATDLIAEAHAKGDLVGKDYTDMVKKVAEAYDTATNDAQKLIDKYDTEGAKARQLAEDRIALNAVLADGSLKVEGAQKAMDKLTEAEKKNNKEANAWAEVWKNAVKRIDDTFASLWKDLFSGTKSTLESMKDAIASWLAEVAHALLTKPLVVAITTAMTGTTGVAGAAGTAGTAGQAVSGLSSFSSIGSMFSTAFQLGSTFLSGVSEGIMGMFSTNMFSTIGTAWGAATSGSAVGAAAGLGVMAAYAAPLLLAGGLIFSKWQKDQEPRYGAYGATTTGRSDQFEGGLGVKGAFGLTFGMNDMGTANVDPEEQRALLEGFAKVSQAMADFYGKDVEAAVKASLAKASMENWGKNGLMNYAANAEQAFQIAFTDIIKHAAATGDAVAVVMSSVVGSLQGTMEEMAGQIERGMIAAKAAVGLAEALQGQEGGARLGLDNKDTLGNAFKLIEYANNMKQAGETTAEAIGRMALNLTVFDGALTLTGTKTDATGGAFVELANSLATAADEAKIGMQGLAQLQALYYQNFFTEEERALKQKEDSIKAIAKWNDEQGLAGIESSAQLRAYVESLDLNTEAGQKAYVEAMKIVGAFMSLDDALKKLGETIPAITDAFEEQRKALRDMADQLDPADPLSQSQRDSALAALRKAGYQGDLYDAKGIADFMRALADLDDAGGEAGAELQKFIDTFTGIIDELARIAEERLGLQMRLFEMVGTDDQILALRRQQELAAADVSNREILRMIYLIEDLTKAETDRINTEYEAKVKAINAERTAAIAAYESRMASLSAERTAAQEMASLAEGTLSIIKSALSNLRAGLAFNAGSQAAAARQLAVWAQSGRLPESEPLQRVLDTLGRSGQQDYATQNEYRAAQGSTYANLLKLESVGTVQVDWAKRTVESIDRQITAAQAEHQAVLSAFDAQLQQAAQWRDDELAELRNLSFLTAEQRKALDDLLKSLMPAPDHGAHGWDPNQQVLKIYPAASAVGISAISAKPMPQRHLEEMQALREEIITLREDMAASSTAQVIPIKDIATRLQKWDLDGLPESTSADGTALRVA